MPTNDNRADWAMKAVSAFAEATGQDRSGDLEHEPETVIQDLLCDLMHLCKREKHHFNLCYARAQGNFNDEVAHPNDADVADGPPPYDAATATGMYDRDA